MDNFEFYSDLEYDTDDDDEDYYDEEEEEEYED